MARAKKLRTTKDILHKYIEHKGNIKKQLILRGDTRTTSIKSAAHNSYTYFSIFMLHTYLFTKLKLGHGFVELS